MALGDRHQVHVVRFDPSKIRQPVRIAASPNANDDTKVKSLSSPANFARFYLHDALPDVDKIIYMDLDMIVQGDISDVWNAQFMPGHIMAVTPRLEHTIGTSSDFVREWKLLSGLYKQYYGHKLGAHDHMFNAGMYMLNLTAWRLQNKTQEIEYWMQAHAQSERPLWKLGTQPLLTIVTMRQWTPLDQRWMLRGLGQETNDDVTDADVRDAYLLHWSGHAAKPWHSGALYGEYWQKYAVSECSGHGTCDAGVCLYQMGSGRFCKNGVD